MPFKLLRITSNDKYIPDSKTNSDFTVYLKEEYQTQEVKNITVYNAIVPNIFYNVVGSASNGTINNIFSYLENGQSASTVVVPEGQYLLADFLSALQTALNADLVSGSVLITLDNVTKKIVFTFTGTTVIIYNLSDGNLMASLLGLTTTTADLGSITMNSVPDLSGLNEVYIHSKELADANLVDGDRGSISVVCAVSFSDAPFGTYAHYQATEYSNNRILYPDTRNITKISIRLRDNKGNVLDIGTHDLSLIVKMEY